MSKIIVTFVILSIFAATLCQEISFLQEESEFDIDNTEDQDFSLVDVLLALPSLKPEEAFDFIKGFNTGFVYLSKLPHAGTCELTDPSVVDDVNEIVEVFSDFSISKGRKIITTVMEKAASIYVKIKGDSANCKAYAVEIKKKGEALKDHVKSATYVAEFTYHGMMNAGKLKSKAKAAQALFLNKKFNEAGSAFGDLIKFAILWNYDE
jgi:hypothetical protein